MAAVPPRYEPKPSVSSLILAQSYPTSSTLYLDQLCIPGVTEGTPDCDAVFFTHYHGDHTGLINQILPSIPLYMGATAIEIFNTYRKRVMESLCTQLLPFTPAVPIVIGEITDTPFLVDHSAFDSYMFLIEGEGTRILHTGDFRLDGFRGRKTIPMLKKYVGQVDWLICEGTALGRAERSFSERDLQQKVRDIMKEHKRVFVLCAATNIDRIAAFYHARPDTHPATCDRYQYGITKIVERAHGEKTQLYRFAHLYPYSQGAYCTGGHYDTGDYARHRFSRSKGRTGHTG